MDLLATVRKEGSRGGTGDFKWSDVQSSSRREHYLGHSLMAPVGRWQQGRDLNWYAKSKADGDDGEDPAEKAARERKEEIRRVKEAEEDALARALGLPVAPRSNANMEPVNEKRDIAKTLADGIGDDQDTAKGVGYGALSNPAAEHVLNETIDGNAESQDKELQHALKEYKRRHGNEQDSYRRHDQDERRHRHSRSSRDERHHRSRRHRSRSRDGHRRRRSSSPPPLRDRARHRENCYRSRPRSPYRSRRDERDRRRERDD